MNRTREVLYLGACYFLTGTIEERIFQRQVSKQGLSGTVVDLGKGAEHTSFCTSELRDLFSLTDTPSLTHDLLNCSCSMDGSVQGRLISDCQHANASILLHWDYSLTFFFILSCHRRGGAGFWKALPARSPSWPRGGDAETSQHVRADAVETFLWWHTHLLRPLPWLRAKPYHLCLPDHHLWHNSVNKIP